MSIEQVESALQALRPEERQRFARWFDDHRHELLERPSETPSADVDSAQQREVLSRLGETEATPNDLESFDEADVARMIEDFANARAQKSPARQG